MFMASQMLILGFARSLFSPESSRPSPVIPSMSAAAAIPAPPGIIASFPVPDAEKSCRRSAARSSVLGSFTPATNPLACASRSAICSRTWPVLWGYGASFAKFSLIFWACLANWSAEEPCHVCRTLVTASSKCFLIPLFQSSPTSELRTFFQPPATLPTSSGLALATIFLRPSSP
ncbi:hypothetical protein CG747_00110 [Streptomyces sp. CB02959]|nr:hypothetical protein CG747_00110 [Streptomyces sp. CB02959]